MPDVISVSALNRYVKTILDADDVLFDLALRGEIANFVCNARSGHCYFSLRDEASSVKAVMFRQDAQRLAFRPEEGMRVVVRCRVTLYERDGAFQVYVSDMFPDGIGSAQLALEQLKQKLYAEGLFAEEHKKPIPVRPSCIGIVTSKTGAALQDIRNVLSRRWPMVKLLLCPVQVQGFAAAAQVAAAIDTLDADGRADVILVARGGGSREDLWVFNAECIARAAFRCKTPLISAIGHEIDTTLLDYAADLRAPTPSAAAELAVPDGQAIRRELYSYLENIHEIMQTRLGLCYNRSAAAQRALFALPCAEKCRTAQTRISLDATRLSAGMQNALARAAGRLRQDAALAHSLSPYRTLARGYALVRGADGDVIAPDTLRPGQTVWVEGMHQKASCLVQASEGTNRENTENL
ncbi:MAG: exodeoxyribonuclease VII large subunit [Faecalibacterium sp.]|jgi:exodeoxyribonuclease VII large subunit|nr:exodeoxyribonuclease VII large subunit [Faecalibacterium sp.]